MKKIKIKSAAKLGGSHKPTLKKTKRLRHNERQIIFYFLLVFAFHPSGLIPFPFGFLATPPMQNAFFFFLFFFFVKLYMCCVA
jgi:hypothetical protein